MYDVRDKDVSQDEEGIACVRQPQNTHRQANHGLNNVSLRKANMEREEGSVRRRIIVARYLSLYTVHSQLFLRSPGVIVNDSGDNEDTPCSAALSNDPNAQRTTLHQHGDEQQLMLIKHRQRTSLCA